MPSQATTQQAAAALGISTSRLRTLLLEGRVVGAEKVDWPGRGWWLIPVDSDTGRPDIVPGSPGNGPRAVYLDPEPVDCP